jgi:hypothetical protein
LSIPWLSLKQGGRRQQSMLDALISERAVTSKRVGWRRETFIESRSFETYA